MAAVCRSRCWMRCLHAAITFVTIVLLTRQPNLVGSVGAHLEWHVPKTLLPTTTHSAEHRHDLVHQRSMLSLAAGNCSSNYFDERSISKQLTSSGSSYTLRLSGCTLFQQSNGPLRLGGQGSDLPAAITILGEQGTEGEPAVLDAEHIVGQFLLLPGSTLEFRNIILHDLLLYPPGSFSAPALTPWVLRYTLTGVSGVSGTLGSGAVTMSSGISGRLFFTNSSIVTTCSAVKAYASWLKSLQQVSPRQDNVNTTLGDMLTDGNTFLYVPFLSYPGTSLTSVHITCPPRRQPVQATLKLHVPSGLTFVQGLRALADAWHLATDSTVLPARHQVLLTQDITLAGLPVPESLQVIMYGNTTIMPAPTMDAGVPSASVVLDLQLTQMSLLMAPNATLTLINITMVNMPGGVMVNPGSIDVVKMSFVLSLTTARQVPSLHAVNGVSISTMDNLWLWSFIPGLYMSPSPRVAARAAWMRSVANFTGAQLLGADSVLIHDIVAAEMTSEGGFGLIFTLTTPSGFTSMLNTQVFDQWIQSRVISSLPISIPPVVPVGDSSELLQALMALAPTDPQADPSAMLTAAGLTARGGPLAAGSPAAFVLYGSAAFATTAVVFSGNRSLALTDPRGACPALTGDVTLMAFRDTGVVLDLHDLYQTCFLQLFTNGSDVLSSNTTVLRLINLAIVLPNVEEIHALDAWDPTQYARSLAQPVFGLQHVFQRRQPNARLELDVVKVIIAEADFRLLYGAMVAAGNPRSGGMVLSQPSLKQLVAMGHTILANVTVMNLTSISDDEIVFSSIDGWGWSGSAITVAKSSQPSSVIYLQAGFSPPGQTRDPADGADEGSGLHLAVAVAIPVVVVLGFACLAVYVALRRRVAAFNDDADSAGRPKLHSNVPGSGSVQADSTSSAASRSPQDSHAKMLGNLREATFKATATAGSPAMSFDIQWGAELQVFSGQGNIRGRGGMGIVLEGRLLDQPVAVKLLHSATTAGVLHDPAIVPSFKQEVRVLSHLESHPNVVRFLGAGVHEERLFLVEELLAGSLHELIHGRQATEQTINTTQDSQRGSDVSSHMPCDPSLPAGLSFGRILSIAHHVACGLSHLHPGVIHRDLKPGNVLLSSLDEHGVAKIGDFGISRIKAATAHVTTNLTVGTAAYMAPECFDERVGPLTEKVDIYALGTVMWEMITGSTPWEGVKPMAIAYKTAVERCRPPLPKEPDPRCPPVLAALIRKCWAHHPHDRPNAPQVAEQLNKLVMSLELDGKA